VNFDHLTRKRVVFDLMCVGGVIGLSAGFFSLLHPKPAPPLPPPPPSNMTGGGPVFRNEWHGGRLRHHRRHRRFFLGIPDDASEFEEHHLLHPNVQPPLTNAAGGMQIRLPVGASPGYAPSGKVAPPSRPGLGQPSGKALPPQPTGSGPL
jgi:hypothetical protein